MIVTLKLSDWQITYLMMRTLEEVEEGYQHPLNQARLIDLYNKIRAERERINAEMKQIYREEKEHG